MATLRFKTNINCDNCIRAVSSFLNAAGGVQSWKVDTGSEDKILSVETNGADARSVQKAIHEAGFEATELSE